MLGGIPPELCTDSIELIRGESENPQAGIRNLSGGFEGGTGWDAEWQSHTMKAQLRQARAFRCAPLLETGRKEKPNVVDHFYNSLGSVAARSGELVHSGWIHPPAACPGRHRSGDQPHPGAANSSLGPGTQDGLPRGCPSDSFLLAPTLFLWTNCPPVPQACSLTRITFKAAAS